MLSQSQRGEASPARSPAPGSAAAPVKRMALSDFEKLVTIAKGSFGTVYKAIRKDNGRVYALKQVEIANMNRAEREGRSEEQQLSHVASCRFPFLAGPPLSLMSRLAAERRARQRAPRSDLNIW